MKNKSYLIKLKLVFEYNINLQLINYSGKILVMHTKSQSHIISGKQVHFVRDDCCTKLHELSATDVPPFCLSKI